MATVKELQLGQWLTAAGYNQAWYDSLTPGMKTRVDALFKSAPSLADASGLSIKNGLLQVNKQSVYNSVKNNAPAPAPKPGTQPGVAATSPAAAAAVSGTTDDQLRAAGLSEQYITSLRGQKETTRALALTAALQGNQQVLLGLSQSEANMSVLTQRAQSAAQIGALGASGAGSLSQDKRDTIGNVLNDPNSASWDDQRILSFQKQLVDAGYLRVGQYVAGDYDTATLNAYHQAILDAVRKGKTPEEQISSRAEALKGAAFGFTPPVKQMADPAAVQTIVTKIFNDATGHDPDPGTLKRLIGEFRSFEGKVYANQVTAAQYQQKQSYAQQAGGSMPAAPTLTGPQSESDIEAEIRGDITTKSDAGDTFAHSMGQQLQTLSQILKGG